MTTARAIIRATPDADYRVVRYKTPEGLRFGLAERLFGAPHFYAVKWNDDLHPYLTRLSAQAIADTLRFESSGAAPMDTEELRKAIALDVWEPTPSATTRRVVERSSPVPGATYSVSLVRMHGGENRYGLCERLAGTNARKPVVWKGDRAPWISRSQAQRAVNHINRLTPPLWQ